jgi:hypothetical protein
VMSKLIGDFKYSKKLSVCLVVTIERDEIR